GGGGAEVRGGAAAGGGGRRDLTRVRAEDGQSPQTGAGGGGDGRVDGRDDDLGIDAVDVGARVRHHAVGPLGALAEGHADDRVVADPGRGRPGGEQLQRGRAGAEQVEAGRHAGRGPHTGGLAGH